MIVIIIRPCQAMTVNSTLAIVTVTRVDEDAGCIKISSLITTLQINITEIGIIGNILINATLVVWVVAISIAVVC